MYSKTIKILYFENSLHERRFNEVCSLMDCSPDLVPIIYLMTSTTNLFKVLIVSNRDRNLPELSKYYDKVDNKSLKECYDVLTEEEHERVLWTSLIACSGNNPLTPDQTESRSHAIVTALALQKAIEIPSTMEGINEFDEAKIIYFSRAGVDVELEQITES